LRDLEREDNNKTPFRTINTTLQEGLFMPTDRNQRQRYIKIPFRIQENKIYLKNIGKEAWRGERKEGKSYYS